MLEIFTWMVKYYLIDKYFPFWEKKTLPNYFEYYLVDGVAARQANQNQGMKIGRSAPRLVCLFVHRFSCNNVPVA